MKVLIGTLNPTKIKGARKSFTKFYNGVEMIGVEVKSDVPEQPFNDDVLQGAKNRVEAVKKYAKENGIDADFFVAIEAGIVDYFGASINFNISVVEDKTGMRSVGISQGFQVPSRYIGEIKEKGFGKVMDKLFSMSGLGQSVGGINFLTKGSVRREDIVENSFTMALVPFVNGDLWK